MALKLLEGWEFRYNTEVDWKAADPRSQVWVTAIHVPCQTGFTCNPFYEEGDWILHEVIDHDKICKEK